ncbi:transglutaminaseTgpA domain-containing protein [Streptomyces sp. B6B3]|uniref:transglutaminase TgpA family protein n=1 Tax=Streptomyces sp. B6B3 TaxID=3153570 RepID=UPI00325D009D
MTGSAGMPNGGGGTETTAGLDGRVRIAFAAWLATLAAASALLPLVSEREWLVPAGTLLACQTATGMLLRWRAVPGPLVLFGQALVSLLLLTATTVPDYAIGGVLPGPAAFDRFGQLLSVGADDISTYVAPAPVTDGIQLMLLGGVLLVGLVVDLLAVSLHSAAASGLPLLALYSVAAGVNQDGASWPYFLCAAAGFLVLLLAEGRHRLTRWGRFFSAPAVAWRPSAQGYPAAPPPPPPPVPEQGPRVHTGRRIGAATLAVAVLAPMLLPSLGDGLLGLDGQGSGAGGEAGDVAAVNPVVALQDQLNQPDDRTVLRYAASDVSETEPLYLRLVALDEFDGAEWRSSGWYEDTPPPASWQVPGLTSTEVSTSPATVIIAADDDYAQNSLPVPYPATWIDTTGDWAFDRGSQTLVSHDGLTTEGRSYEVAYLRVEPTAEQLAAAPTADEELLDYYTRTPENLPSEVSDAAEQITSGATNDYDRAVALQDWFTQDGGFRYDTSVASGTGSDAIVRFLEQREGFCVHFAFTMAAMARTLGIPAQVAVGFTPGDLQPDGSFEVGIHNAHAWPELYFEGIGWVRFEPTPGQGSAPDYTVPEQTDPDQVDPTDPEEDALPEPTPSDTEPSTPSASESEGCDPVLDPAACADEPVRTPDSDDAGLALAVWPMIFGGGGLLLAGLLCWPMLWRRRLRGARLGRGGGALPAWREVTDTAWDFGLPPRNAETPRQTAARIVRGAGLTEEAAGAAHRLADAVEHALYAPRPPAGAEQTRVDRLGADVRTVTAGLRAGASRGTRLRALLLPRSAMRVMYAITERRLRVARRLTRARARVTAPRRSRQGA